MYRLASSYKIFLVIYVLSNPLIAASDVWAANYYLSLSGSNSYPGTQSQPWRTIQHAADSVASGDTVYVREGSYTEQVTISKSGTSNKPIGFQAYNGENPVVHGSFTLRNMEYVHITGFTITGSTGNGAIFIEYGGHNTIHNNRIHDTGSYAGIYIRRSCYNIISSNDVSRGNRGIEVWADSTYNRIEYNHVYMNDKSGGDADGIIIYGSGTRFNIIKKNIVHDNSDDGIDTWNGNYQLIVGNIAYHNGYDTDGTIGYDGNGVKLGGQEYGARGGYQLVINNIACNNRMMGFTTNGGPNPDTLYHNVAFKNYRGFEEWNGRGTFRNNIAYSNRSGQTDFANDTISSNNLFSGNPLFVDGSNHDFHLQSESPAIDSGRNLDSNDIPSVFLTGVEDFFRDEVLYQISHDFDGNPRPQGINSDMGAYEYQASTSGNQPTLPNNLSVR